MPVVTRGSFYHTISGVVAQAPIREFSLPIVGFLDARCGPADAPRPRKWACGRGAPAGEVRRAIGGGQGSPLGQTCPSTGGFAAMITFA